MKNELVITDKLAHDAEEIEAGFIERIHTAREEVILAHHEVGRILHESENVTALVQLLIKRGKIGERTLWDCAAFYKAFPDLKKVDKLGHGKNLSWNKIKEHISPSKKKEKDDCKHCKIHCP